MRFGKAAGCIVLMLAIAGIGLGAFAESAVVDNGSNPDSRLNMRREPSRESEALGSFYSGTKVEIVADAGDGWAQVSIGGELNSISGYMMASYLRSGSEGSDVLNATKERQVVSPYGTQCVVLRDRPSDSYDAVSMLTVGDSVTVIGLTGSFYYVQMSDSSVGCLAENELK